MPTYDYVCDACGHAFEHRQSMTSKIKRTCPECKKRKLRRLIGSGAGVIFKGSGFYETDYKRKNRGGPKPSEKSDDAKPAEKPSDPKSGQKSGPKSGEKSSAKKPAPKMDGD